MSEAIVFYHLACCWRQSHIKVQTKTTLALPRVDSLTGKKNSTRPRQKNSISALALLLLNWESFALIAFLTFRYPPHQKPHSLRRGKSPSPPPAPPTTPHAISKMAKAPYWATLRVCAAIRSLKQLWSLSARQSTLCIVYVIGMLAGDELQMSVIRWAKACVQWELWIMT